MFEKKKGLDTLKLEKAQDNLSSLSRFDLGAVIVAAKIAFCLPKQLRSSIVI